MTTAMMVATEHAEQVKRLTEFAADVFDLATERRDLDVRALVDDLHADLLRFNVNEED